MVLHQVVNLVQQLRKFLNFINEDAHRPAPRFPQRVLHFERQLLWRAKVTPKFGGAQEVDRDNALPVCQPVANQLRLSDAARTEQEKGFVILRWKENLAF